MPWVTRCKVLLHWKPHAHGTGLCLLECYYATRFQLLCFLLDGPVEASDTAFGKLPVHEAWGRPAGAHSKPRPHEVAGLCEESQRQRAGDAAAKIGSTGGADGFQTLCAHSQECAVHVQALG